MPSKNKESCFWKIANVWKPVTFLLKDVIFLHDIYNYRKIALYIFIFSGLKPILMTYSLVE